MLSLAVTAALATDAQALNTFDDSDHDGLSDQWEATDGQKYGAKIGRKDVFFQLDWTYCIQGNNSKNEDKLTHSFNSQNIPRFKTENVRKVIKAFRDELGPNESWCAHIDNGEALWGCDDLSPNGSNLYLNPNSQALAKARAVGPVNYSGELRFDDQFIFDFYFRPERAKVFHYGLVGCDPGGISAKDDLVVNFSNQSYTMMHEFGHRFHLGHGGDDNINYKSNYPSIMNYSLVTKYQKPFSIEKLGDLDEFHVCEKNGLGIKLGGKAIDVYDLGKLYHIPEELYWLHEGGMPFRSIREDGAIDWNGDGIFSECAQTANDYQEANVELDFGDLSLARDKNIVVDITKAPQLFEVNGRLGVAYFDQNQTLRLTYGPNSTELGALKKTLETQLEEQNASLFSTDSVPINLSASLGKIISTPSIVSLSGSTLRAKYGDLLLIAYTESGHLLRLSIFVDSDQNTLKIKSATSTAGSPSLTQGHPQCDLAAAYDSSKNQVTVISRSCDTGELSQVLSLSATGADTSLYPLGLTSEIRPALVYDEYGNSTIFATASQTENNRNQNCAYFETNILYVASRPAGQTSYQSKWLGLDTKECIITANSEVGHDNGLTAAYDSSSKRSLAGKMILFFRGKGYGNEYNLFALHYDLAGQLSDRLHTLYSKLHSPILAWQPIEDKYGPGTGVSTLMYQGKAVMLYAIDARFAPGPRKAWNGSLVFSPSADGINRKLIQSHNDLVTLNEWIPKTIQNQPYPDVSVRQGFENDQDGDGTPDAVDSCPRDYNLPTLKNADGQPLGDSQGLTCKSELEKMPLPLQQQLDSDADGIIDNNDADKDGDGICDRVTKSGNSVQWQAMAPWCGTDPGKLDNCLGVDFSAGPNATKIYGYNPDQKDSNSDGIGDACDKGLHVNLKGIVNFSKPQAPLSMNFNVWGSKSLSAQEIFYDEPTTVKLKYGYCVCESLSSCKSCNVYPQTYINAIDSSEIEVKLFSHESRSIQGPAWKWFDNANLVQNLKAIALQKIPFLSGSIQIAGKIRLYGLYLDHLDTYNPNSAWSTVWKVGSTQEILLPQTKPTTTPP